MASIPNRHPNSLLGLFQRSTSREPEFFISHFKYKWGLDGKSVLYLQSVKMRHSLFWGDVRVGPMERQDFHHQLTLMSPPSSISDSGDHVGKSNKTFLLLPARLVSFEAYWQLKIPPYPCSTIMRKLLLNPRCQWRPKREPRIS